MLPEEERADDDEGDRKQHQQRQPPVHREQHGADTDDQHQVEQEALRHLTDEALEVVDIIEHPAHQRAHRVPVVVVDTQADQLGVQLLAQFARDAGTHHAAEAPDEDIEDAAPARGRHQSHEDQGQPVEVLLDREHLVNQHAGQQRWQEVEQDAGDHHRQQRRDGVRIGPHQPQRADEDAAVPVAARALAVAAGERQPTAVAGDLAGATERLDDERLAGEQALDLVAGLAEGFPLGIAEAYHAQEEPIQADLQEGAAHGLEAAHLVRLAQLERASQWSDLGGVGRERHQHLGSDQQPDVGMVALQGEIAAHREKAVLAGDADRGRFRRQRLGYLAQDNPYRFRHRSTAGRHRTPPERQPRPL